MCNQLSPQQLELLLRKFLPSLEQDYAVLEAHLQNKRWKGASQQAHKLLSVSKLLGMDTLIPLLQQVEACDSMVQTAIFLNNIRYSWQENVQILTRQSYCP